MQTDIEYENQIKFSDMEWIKKCNRSKDFISNLEKKEDKTILIDDLSSNCDTHF